VRAELQATADFIPYKVIVTLFRKRHRDIGNFLDVLCLIFHIPFLHSQFRTGRLIQQTRVRCGSGPDANISQ
jgi:hypothetical protein